MPTRRRLIGRPPSRPTNRATSDRSTTAWAKVTSVVSRCSIVSMTRLTSNRTTPPHLDPHTLLGETPEVSLCRASYLAVIAVAGLLVALLGRRTGFLVWRAGL